MVDRDNERSWRFGRVAATAGLLTIANIWAVGCGGTSVSHGEAGRGGDGGSAGMGTAANGAGGAGGTGPAGAGAGGAGTGGTSGGTAGSAGKCPVLDCDDVPCPDGVLIQEECACPVCSCLEVTCPVQDCADGQQPILRPGACCPVCPDPDIDACDTSNDCVLAFSTLECCGCPRAVSKRHYEEDACLLTAWDARELPDHCAIPCPTIVCSPCPEQASFCDAGVCGAITGQR